MTRGMSSITKIIEDMTKTAKSMQYDDISLPDYDSDAEYNSADELKNYLATDIRSSQLSEQKKRIKRGMKKVRRRKLGKRALDEGSSSEQSADESEKYYHIPTKLTTSRGRRQKSIKRALKSLGERINGSKALDEVDDEVSSDQPEDDL
jgi:hypothetical protein